MSAPDDSAHGARPIARPEGAGPGLSALLALDPLSPFAAIAPLAVVIAALSTPVPALWTLGVAAVVLVTADLRRGPVLVVVVLALAAIVGSALAVSAPIERVGASPVVIEALSVGLQRNQVLAGVRLGGKLGAVLSLLLLTGLLAGPRDLLRAMVIHLHVPYRIAYAGMAALGFRERFAIEYRVIQEAHALRGTRVSPSFLRPLVRRWTAVPALMAGAAPRRAGVHVDGRARLRSPPPPNRALGSALAMARHHPRPGLLGADGRHRRAFRRCGSHPPRDLTSLADPPCPRSARAREAGGPAVPVIAVTAAARPHPRESGPHAGVTGPAAAGA